MIQADMLGLLNERRLQIFVSFCDLVALSDSFLFIGLQNMQLLHINEFFALRIWLRQLFVLQKFCDMGIVALNETFTCRIVLRFVQHIKADVLVEIVLSELGLAESSFVWQLEQILIAKADQRGRFIHSSLPD